MRTALRNKRTIWYALYKGVEDVIDEDGNYTGEQRIMYDTPVLAHMNVSGGRGKADIELFGVDNPFTMTCVTDDLKTEFNTDTVFWFRANPSTDAHNFRCTGISRTINQVVIALAEVDKTHDEVVSA